ncbi:RagB/SusD family nutrient uptake outer membrane protein [Aureibaculum sp. 2210JD6-5]|uniref:RagB/SusD family nutrient uptake outer membrane protein n=1 Tax=Aureibaculum sp. 2210JD6-5 TaxID=3103957 RepID=UPI002AADB070|nr:RagB/SusD family nutrient uptake outer membrane protein [Aureibaculum sp. 2210JD6-5]MDY7394330.1 RagB/SusD family nutrient uptake outer membrane protein [Aureibaculum sp. 2210JD6-5]
MDYIKLIKNLRVVFLAGLLMIPMSCNDDLLDKLPLGEVANNEELGVGGQEVAVFGIYSLLRTTNVGSWNRHWFGSIRSDDAQKGSTSGDSAANGTAFNDFEYIATNGLSTGWWNAHYEVIFACNEVINNIAESGATDEGSLINDAEARVIRALMYFELRRDYGEVPIITVTIDVPSDAFAPKSSVADIDQFIKDDLEIAEQNLPLTWASFPGRATSGFAKSLLAKLYLYQKDWANAYSKCQEVIDSGVYMLDPSLINLFERGGNNGVESIFEIQQTVTEGGQQFNSIYYISQGVRGTGAWNLGWGFNTPTQNLVDAFEPGDARKANTILESGQDDGGFGSGTLPESPPLAQKYWNKKAYTMDDIRSSLGVNSNRWENIKIIRYADVLLMAAEAGNESGVISPSEVADLINMIRSRAGLPNTSASSQSELRDAIKQERRVELALEEYRFYNLVRWGDATSVLGSLGYEPKHALYPIPQEAIDNSGGVIVQNPDY